jgi:hypothetical protein
MAALAAVSPLPAQRTHAFAVAGPIFPVNSSFTRYQGTFVSVAGGIEGHLHPVFAINGEAGGLFGAENQLGPNVLSLSVGPSVHFLGRRARLVDPFVTAGPQLFVVRGGSAGLGYVGGGANVWINERLALRVEVRDSFALTFEKVQFVGVRFGVAFR